MAAIFNNPFVISIIGIVLSAAIGQLVKYLLERLTGKVITIPQVLVFALVLGVVLFFYVYYQNGRQNGDLPTTSNDATVSTAVFSTSPASTAVTTTPAPAPEAVEISIISPGNNGKVDQRTDIEYKIEGKIPEGYTHYILVQDPLGQYWSWGTAPDFKQSIQIGEAQDKGKTFRIGIIITNEDIQLNTPYQVRPAAYKYEEIKVTRK